ncbi:MAG: recombinase [Alphaproteobacteria bacterium]|nr:recombinase [Alphaproteobacteria bacterium]
MKAKTYKQLIKDLDKVYSIYIRKKGADSEGQVKCYTCDKVKHWKSMDCGHYISRRKLSTRYSEKNTKPQCKGCNVFQEGNKPVFALRLQKEYGKGILEELDQLSHIQVKYSKTKLSNMIFYYKKK